MVAGGDGTVKWIISEFFKFKIEFARVPIGVIPLGTGNDFSNACGWG